MTVADPRWVLPGPDGLVQLATSHRLVVTVEDNIRTGCAGCALAQAVVDTGSVVPVRVLGLPAAFIAHGTRHDLLASAGLDRDGIVHAVLQARAIRPVEIPTF
ncbi:transketolase C-terminal domain-containing protein [Streptomyces sp. NPDC059443]|uniref:transketolase C-terminal domain-containing protein n=1 Tax=unclassified Streptomyces TaxID=2593676 RepID=UPI0036CE6053